MVYLKATNSIVYAHQKRNQVSNIFKIRSLTAYKKEHSFCFFAALLFFPSCKSPDKLIGDSNVFADTDVQPSVEPSGEPGTPSSISDLLSTDIAEGSLVALTDIVVTSPSDDDGFFVGDQSGGPNSGIFVQADFEQKSVFDVSIGETVDVVGTFLEVEGALVADSAGYDNTLSTLSISNIEDVAVTGESQTPVQAVPFEYSDPSDIETYEGVLVSIESPSVIKIEDTGLVYLNNILVLNNRYYEYSEMALLEGTVNEITGIIGYENGNYVLYPRSVDDIDYTYAEDPAVEIYFTEFFVGRPEDTICQPNFDWYIEVHYALDNIGEFVDLNGNIYISNENDTQGYLQYSRINAGHPIFPGDSFLLTNSNSENCLNNPESTNPVLSVELVNVEGSSGDLVTDVDLESTFKLIFSENDASMVNGDYVILNEVIIDIPSFGLNSYELSPLATPEDNNFLNQNNGFWTESTTPLMNQNNVPLVNNFGATLHGSPGTMSFHSSQ